MLQLVKQLDLSQVEKKYSSLGRHGYSPQSLLAVWVYASWIGIHEATKVARLLKTDAAFALLSGGYAISGRTLRRFRQQSGALFADVLEQTVRIAMEHGLLEPKDLAIDSLRIRAHASMTEVRTLERSEKRLEELAKEIPTNEAEQARHDAKVSKHEKAIRQCQQRGRTNIVLTNELAGLMKFPNGTSQPGHRVTTTTSGSRNRIVVSVLIDTDSVDFGKLGAAVSGAREVLHRCGLAKSEKMQVAADAGYFCERDLRFAANNQEWVDLLIAEGETGGAHRGETKYFDRTQFEIRSDATAICPAGRLMSGPKVDKGARVRYEGKGCPNCELRPQCTGSQKRSLSIHPEMDVLRQRMRDRMAAPGAKERYGQRIATAEPVYANIEHVMGFRRASSRCAQTVVAEILLKILTHNLSRLLAARRLLWIRITWIYSGQASASVQVAA